VFGGDAPAGWSTLRGESMPWSSPTAPPQLAWVAAGAMLDETALGELRTLLAATPRAAGTFPWLRPTSPRPPFPWLPDLCLDDLLLEGASLPTCVVVRTADLASCPTLVGLDDPATRIAALAMSACAVTGARLFHPGRPAGEFAGAPFLVSPHVQRGGLGFLELAGRWHDATLWPGRST
jgi:hypothetical protein